MPCHFYAKLNLHLRKLKLIENRT